VIYLVSGYRRSGTSAMMRALIAGGLKAVRDGELEFRGNAPDSTGYKPNPGGLYEIGRNFWRQPPFLAALRNGLVYKAFFDILPNLPARSCEYAVVFMRRDPAEIRLSLERTRAYLVDRGIIGVSPQHWPFDVYRDYDQRCIDMVLGICQQRRDVRLMEVDYAELVADPLRTLSRVGAFFELPDFGLEAAAEVIDPELYRYHAGACTEAKTGL